jgi:hypothetical protein
MVAEVSIIVKITDSIRAGSSLASSTPIKFSRLYSMDFVSKKTHSELTASRRSLQNAHF